MYAFEASLLREKFEINDLAGDGQDPVIVVSNRIVCRFSDHDDDYIVIRAQNMEQTIRTLSHVLDLRVQGKFFRGHARKIDWSKVWQNVDHNYERLYNPSRWIVIYEGGVPIYTWGEHHPFFDVIEKFYLNPDADYDRTLRRAEAAFKKTGKLVQIGHESSVAYTVHSKTDVIRQSIVMRDVGRTMVLNFSTRTQHKDQDLYQSLHRSVSVGGAYTEAIELCFDKGMIFSKRRAQRVDHKLANAQAKAARTRLDVLQAEISNYERMFSIHYRPEKPNFPRMIAEAEQRAEKII